MPIYVVDISLLTNKIKEFLLQMKRDETFLLQDQILILFEQGLESADIAAELGITVKTVNEIKNFAVNHKKREVGKLYRISGCLKVTIEADIPTERREIAVENLYGEIGKEIKELNCVPNDIVPEIKTIYTKSISDIENATVDEWLDAVEQYAVKVAPMIDQLIRDRHNSLLINNSPEYMVCFLGWGRTLIRVVERIVKPNTQPLLNNIRFCPGWGEPCGVLPKLSASRTDEKKNFKRQFVESASLLAIELDNHYRGTISETHSLRGIPGIIPSFLPEKKDQPFSKSELKEALKMRKQFSESIRALPMYRHIFGSNIDSLDGSLISIADGAFLALGASSNYGSGHLTDYFSKEHLISGSTIDPDLLSKEAVGDIGGCLVPKPGFENVKGQVNELEERWLGIRLDHLKLIAARCEENSIGVVGLAVGADRAPTIMRILTSGLKVINRLYIDANCAKELRKLIKLEKRIESLVPEEGTVEFTEWIRKTAAKYEEDWKGAKVEKSNQSINTAMIRETIREAIQPT